MCIYYSAFNRFWCLTMCIVLLACRGKASDAFEYRSIYTPTNANGELRHLWNTHHVDYDWGLWGHNLHKVFHDGIPQEAHAKVKGQVYSEQFCFSSDELYKAVEYYITENFGEGTATAGERFSLMPNDNAIVCQCEQCQKAGNTASSATPAVAQLTTRLAKRFPHHVFFTSSYGTTAVPPSRPLPANTGVWISAMELPYTLFKDSDREVADFKALVARWETVVGRVYVWDYMRNYDNYFIPYPCLSIIRKRLLLFRSIGIKGVFYNGSGDTYASFDDVQTYVVSRLLEDPDISVSQEVSKFFSRTYPTAGQLLTNYYLKLEKAITDRRIVLPYYGGITHASNYLESSELQAVCQALNRLVPNTRTEERNLLAKLQTALSMTQLEMMRAASAPLDPKLATERLTRLEEALKQPDMQIYREAEGSLQRYIRQWKDLMAYERPAGNILFKKPLKLNDPAISCLQLTDGRYGLPSDYHTSWQLFAGHETELTITAPSGPPATLSLSFMYAPRWRIRLPRQISVWQDNRMIAQVPIPAETEQEAFTRIKIVHKLQTFSSTSPVVLRITQQEGARINWACDEIEWYENN